MFTPAPTPYPNTFDPPAPVMGGMRWARPLCGPDPYWEDWEKRGRTTTITAEHSPPTNRPAPPKPNAYTYERAAPVRITTTPPPEGQRGEEYRYAARAHDADTDGFIWYLETAAPGMTVDRYTGVVTWTPPDGGWYEATLCAKTLYGKVAQQTWTICVRKPPVQKSSTPNPRFRAALHRRNRSRSQSQSVPPHRSRIRPSCRTPILPAGWRTTAARASPQRRAASPPDAPPRAATVAPLRI